MKALKLIFLMMGLALAASSCCRRTVSEVSNKATEISASSSVAVVSTDKGKVAGYVENGIYIGFVSKSKIFNSYRRVFKNYTDD